MSLLSVAIAALGRHDGCRVLLDAGRGAGGVGASGARQFRRSRREAAAVGRQHLDDADREAGQAGRQVGPAGRNCRPARRSRNSSRIFSISNGQRGDRRAAAAAQGDLARLGISSSMPAGYVVTNNHVIADADEITVILHDDTRLKAEVLGRDSKTDVAVLKVKTDKKLVAAAWGDSDKARVGDWVLAIGNPFGLGGSVTAGILSARQRDINSGPLRRFPADRRLDQPGQLGRTDVQHGGPGHRHRHRDLLAERRLDRHRLCDPVQYGEGGRDRADPRPRARRASRLARRPHPGGHRRGRREPRARQAARRAGRQRQRKRPGPDRRHPARRCDPQLRRQAGQRHAPPAARRRRDQGRQDRAGDGLAQAAEGNAAGRGRTTGRNRGGRRQGDAPKDKPSKSESRDRDGARSDIVEHHRRS